MSREFYNKTIKPEVERIQEEEGLSSEGLAFQQWLINLYCEYDQHIDESEALSFPSRDGGVDILLFNQSQEHIYVIQAKFISTRNTVKSEDILAFASRRAKLEDRDYVENSTNLSVAAKDGLLDYVNKLESGWQATWLFITTGKIPQEIAEDQDGYPECEVYDITKIKMIHKEANAQNDPIPDSVSFSISDNKFIEFSEPRKTLIAVVKGNALRNLYDQHLESLLAYNVRKFMGDNKINTKMRATAREKGEDFLYFNNGISAICTSFEVNGNRVTAKKFQIINGGQTIGSLHKAGVNDDVQVSLKLCVGEGLATERGFNREVILYNNTQNAIKDSDFRSNDEIQLHIKKRFESLKIKDSIFDKKIEYHPKRGGRRPKPGYRSISLEQLGKIRYAYKHEPCTPIDKAKNLWNLDAEYKKAFGDPCGEWTDDEFNETLLALAFYDSIQRIIKEQKSASGNGGTNSPEDLKSRLRLHILALAHIYVGHEGVGVDLWKNKKEFEKVFKDFWSEQRPCIRAVINEAKGQNVARGAISNLIRQQTRWKQLKADFEDHLGDKLKDF